MELRKEGNRFRNGLDELIELEDDYLYPMLKSSEITNRRGKEPTRWMLVTQKAIGDETSVIPPRCAQNVGIPSKARCVYLIAGQVLIYRNRPRFSIFGVGDYTFAQLEGRHIRIL